MMPSWEHKLQALQALSPVELCMRKPGDWFVSQRVEIGGGGLLVGKYGNGATPSDAVNDHWSIMTTLRPGSYLVTNAMSDRRKCVIWNGFMWEDVTVAGVTA